MTQEAPRYCMEPVDPHEGRLADGKGGYFCGLPLVPTEGPCVTCGRRRDDGDDELWHADHAVRNIGRVGYIHPYQPPVSCPIHRQEGVV